MDNPCFALTVFDDGLGGGSALYAGGTFTTAGGVLVYYVAKWTGMSWSALGSGMDGIVRALTVFSAMPRARSRPPTTTRTRWWTWP